jgi:hypothetical protein
MNARTRHVLTPSAITYRYIRLQVWKVRHLSYRVIGRANELPELSDLYAELL